MNHVLIHAHVATNAAKEYVGAGDGDVCYADAQHGGGAVLPATAGAYANSDVSAGHVVSRTRLGPVPLLRCFHATIAPFLVSRLSRDRLA